MTASAEQFAQLRAGQAAIQAAGGGLAAANEVAQLSNNVLASTPRSPAWSRPRQMPGSRPTPRSARPPGASASGNPLLKGYSTMTRIILALALICALGLCLSACVDPRCLSDGGQPADCNF